MSIPKSEAVLLVGTDPSVMLSLQRLLQSNGWRDVETASSGQEVLEQAQKRSFAVVLFDLGLPDLSADAVFQGLKERRPETPIVVMTSKSDLTVALKFVATGAFDYVLKGREIARLIATVDRAIRYYQKSTELTSLQQSFSSTDLKNPTVFANIVTSNEQVMNVLRMAEAVSQTDESILITGETGVGKELLARDIHICSGRPGSFVGINAGALEDPVFDDTLFGHVRGAFTGADQMRKGLAASADDGTLFLDEVGDLKPQGQVKLLRFLESKEYFPLGSDSPRRSYARVIAATNTDLDAAIARGAFRKDLLYRLSTFHLFLPPLRARPEDIVPIGNYLLGLLTTERGGRPVKITAGAARLLESLPLPGNVRELRQILLRAMIASGSGDIDGSVLEALGYRQSDSVRFDGADVSFPSKLPTVREAVEALIREALRRTGGKQSAAGALIGLSPQAMSKRLKKRSSTP